MSWVNDLASGLGIPAGAVTLAVAMYGACTTAEKAARPEALNDIAKVLKNPSWSRSVRPSAIIDRVFLWTFGERHLSLKCIRTSLLATIAIVSAGLIIQEVLAGTFSAVFFPNGFEILNMLTAPFVVALVSLVAAFPDYLALWKTRLLLRWLSKNPPSLLIWVLVLLASEGFTDITMPFVRISHDLLHFSDNETSLAPAFISTLFTSIWIFFVVISSTAIKLLAPLQRFTSWFFDIDNHPVKALGIVSSALLMSGSLIWTIIRATV
jgi:hypothetical protein